MAKLRISLSRISGKDVPEDQKDTVSITFKKPGENNPAQKLRELFTECQKIISGGTGCTITFEYNGGEKQTIYLDGDGADRILEVV